MSILSTNMAATLRSLTKSPITSALDQARRMAKQHLEAGGAAGAGSDDDGVVLPADVDVSAIVAAIAAAFGAGSDRRRYAADALLRRRDGRVVVRRACVRKLGDGDFAVGKRVLARLIDSLSAGGGGK